MSWNCNFRHCASIEATAWKNSMRARHGDQLGVVLKKGNNRKAIEKLACESTHSNLHLSKWILVRR